MSVTTHLSAANDHALSVGTTVADNAPNSQQPGPYQDVESVEFVAVSGDGHVLYVTEHGQRDDGVDALPQQPVLHARLVEVVPQLRQRPLASCGQNGAVNGTRHRLELRQQARSRNTTGSSSVNRPGLGTTKPPTTIATLFCCFFLRPPHVCFLSSLTPYRLCSY